MKNTLILLLAALGLIETAAQPNHAIHHAASAHFVFPHTRPFAAATTRVSDVNAAIEIVEQVATTTLDISVTNDSNARIEAVMVLPVPVRPVPNVKFIPLAEACRRPLPSPQTGGSFRSR